MKHSLTRADIMPMPEYAKIRAEKRRATVEVKRRRRVEVGPFALLMFESWDTMWLQVHEMLYIEKGGDEQIAGELEAYNPLIPKGRELVATVMFQIEDPVRRRRELGRLGGVEETAFLKVGGEEILGRPEEDQDRSTDEGKASSVQFIHFPFTDAAAAAFKQAGTEIMVGFRHANYPHMTQMAEEVRATLAGDLA